MFDAHKFFEILYLQIDEAKQMSLDPDLEEISRAQGRIMQVGSLQISEINSLFDCGEIDSLMKNCLINRLTEIIIEELTNLHDRRYKHIEEVVRKNE